MSKRKEALLLRLQGLPYSAIGERLGFSRQRAQQLVSPPRAIRREVILRASGRCADCHLIVGKSGHVHHKASVGAIENNFNDLSNLVLLCPSCHFDAHYPGGRTPFENDLKEVQAPKTVTKPKVKYLCTQCSYTWTPRPTRLEQNRNKPLKCPSCQSWDWDKKGD